MSDNMPDVIINAQIDKVCDMALDKDACQQYQIRALLTIQELNASRAVSPPTDKEGMDKVREALGAVAANNPKGPHTPHWAFQAHEALAILDQQKPAPAQGGE